MLTCMSISCLCGIPQNPMYTCFAAVQTNTELTHVETCIFVLLLFPAEKIVVKHRPSKTQMVLVVFCMHVCGIL